jgi:hypothetical protein
MATKFDESVALLYGAPREQFVSERQRLGKELALAGDKSAAALFTKLPRPSVSAWAVNQLWRQARSQFDAFFASATRLRHGDLDAGGEHRRLGAGLAARAAEILKEGGQAATEATLRRVAANLASIAAAGGFDPDPPGALKSDRDSPGFDALTLSGDASTPASKPQAGEPNEQRSSQPPADTGAEARKREKAELARQKAEAEAERLRVAEEQARVRAERRELEITLRTVKTAIERRTNERARLQSELATVESELERALASERAIEARLTELAPREEPESR